MATLFSAVQIVVWASYIALAARILHQRVHQRLPVLLFLSAYCASTSAVLFFLPAKSYAVAWCYSQIGVIVLHIAIALDVAHRSREGFPRLGMVTIVILVGLLVGSCVLAAWPGTVSSRTLSLSRPVVAVLTMKQYIDSSIAIWCALFAGFYAVAAARGERPNVRIYRWAMIGLFAAQGSMYLALVLGYKIATELASVPVVACNLALACLLSERGNEFIPIVTKFSGLSTAELEQLYSERPHIKQ